MDSPELLLRPLEVDPASALECASAEPDLGEVLRFDVEFELDGCGSDGPHQAGQLLADDRDRLRGVAQRVLKSADLAEDAVQNVWTRLFERGRLAETHPAAMAHLVRLEAMHLLRGRQRRHHHEEHACSSRHHDCACCPSEDAERDEAAAELHRAVAELPEVYREVVERYELGGHDQACIAQELGIAEGTVRSRLTRARSLLRGRLEIHGA
jgi:RNA polymerase sigma-70 factor (ECF subfamily)